MRGGITMASSLLEPDPTDNLEERFARLAAVWQQAVAHQSSSRVRDNHPAYQEIIHMGPPVVPYLLRDLETNRRHWFAALAAITGANPVQREEAGDVSRMVDAWLRWGQENGCR